MRGVCAFILVTLLTICSIFPSRVIGAPSPPELRISGNSTLDPLVIARISGLIDAPGLSADTIKKRLQDSNLFSSVRVSRTEKEVTIDLQQKVTWFVIPYFSSDPSGKNFSLIAGKAVLAHEDVFTFARYQVGTNDHEASVGMIGRNILGSPWDATGSASFQDALSWVYTGREITQRLENRYYGGSFELGYRFGLDWKVSLTSYGERHRFQTPDLVNHDGFQWSHKVTFEYNRYYSIDGLGEGHTVQFYSENANPASDFSFYKIGATAKWSVFKRGDFDWVMRPSCDLGFNLPFYQLFELGGQTLRGFPTEQFRDRYDIAILNDLYLTNWSIWALRPRLMLFTDWAFIQGSGRTAVGGGAQFGIRDLLLSAIQVFAGYGFNPNGVAVTVSIGQKF